VLIGLLLTMAGLVIAHDFIAQPENRWLSQWLGAWMLVGSVLTAVGGVTTWLSSGFLVQELAPYVLASGVLLLVAALIFWFSPTLLFALGMPGLVLVGAGASVMYAHRDR
jgi:hypothetical protein